MDAALLPIPLPWNSVVSEELTPNEYINLHLNHTISCIQYWIWDYTCTENTSEVQDTEKTTGPCLLQTHSMACMSHCMWSTHFSKICFSSWLPRSLFTTAQAILHWLSPKKMTLLIGNAQVKKCIHDIPLFKAEMNCKWKHLLCWKKPLQLCSVQYRLKPSIERFRQL